MSNELVTYETPEIIPAPRVETQVKNTQTEIVNNRTEIELRLAYELAWRRPRNIALVTARILGRCNQPQFAERAEYAKPAGNGKVVTGPSIRFVEAALKEYHNILSDSFVTHDDADTRTVRVVVRDLEDNVTYAEDIKLSKTIMRTNPTGREVVSQRPNSSGKVTYIVRAEDDELAIKEAAARSKAIRNIGLRILPSDIVDDAMIMCKITREKVEPSERMHKMLASFATVHVTAEMISAYLNTPIASLSGPQLDGLLKIFTAIRDGEATWQSYTGAVAEPGAELEAQQNAVRDVLAARKGAAKS